ncbi:MAG TPA: AAA family ATPase, partial [Actinomycetota bacterium]
MRILELSLRNYRVFEQVDLELPARVIGIFGANGAGKSTLVESIQFALYGAGRTKKDQIRTHGVLTEAWVRLLFEHGGRQYEVRRVIKGKNHAIEAELLMGDASLAVGVREVDEEVRKLLRMDQQVFRSSVFAEQKQVDAFSDLTKSKRQEMVLRLLGIRPVDEARTAARKEARDLKKRAEDLAGALPDLTEREAALASAREALAKAAARAEEAAEALGSARAAAEAAREAFEESDRARQEVEQVAGLLAAAEEERERLSARRDELSSRIEASRKDLEELPGLEREALDLAGAREALEAARRWAEVAVELREAEAALASSADVDPAPLLAATEEARATLKEAEAAAHRAVAGREGAERDLDRAESELAKAGELDASKPCPTCGQPLGDAFQDVVRHREEEARELRAALDAAAAAAEKAEKARTKAETVAEKAVAEAEDARKASEQRSSLEVAADKLRAKAAKAAEPFDGEPPAVDELEARAARAEEVAEHLASLRAQQAGLDQAQADLDSASADLDACLAKITDLTERRDALSFSPERHAELRKRDAEARAAAEQAVRDEREASDAKKDAEREVASLASAIDQVKEAKARAGELQDEARYADRVSLL